MQRVLFADTTKSGLKIHEYANYALAGATPVAILSSKGSLILKATDMVLAFAVPAHMHVTMNAVITDYLPKAARVPTRYGLMGASAITWLGLMKLNFTGPGITETIRSLWHRPKKVAVE